MSLMEIANRVEGLERESAQAKMTVSKLRSEASLRNQTLDDLARRIHEIALEKAALLTEVAEAGAALQQRTQAAEATVTRLREQIAQARSVLNHVISEAVASGSQSTISYLQTLSEVLNLEQ